LLEQHHISASQAEEIWGDVDDQLFPT
jgi:hypothetical protein